MNSKKFASTVLMAIVSFCILLLQRAEAMILQGYVQQSDMIEPIAESKSTKMLFNARAGPIKMSPVVLPLPVMPSCSLPMTNSYPRLFEGCWQCITTITSSSMTAIRVGTKVVCDVTFFRTANNRIAARFTQPGWTEGKVTVVDLSETEVCDERTNYYFRNALEGVWTARSQDHFMQTEPTIILSESFVEQYINAQLIGNYCTSSILSKQTE